MISDSNRFQNWIPTDQTGSRVLNTPYANIGGAMRMCMVGVECSALVLAEAMAGFQHVITVDRLVGYPAGVIVVGRFSFTFLVPMGASYQVNSFVGVGGGVSLVRWIEVDL